MTAIARKPDADNPDSNFLDKAFDGALKLTSDTRQANWRRANPSKYLAHVAVQRALARGDLVKQPCEVCGTTEGRIDLHHDDYSQPLAVRHLCRKHHNLLHRRGEQGMWGAA